MRKLITPFLLLLVVALCLLILLSGCSMLRAIIPGGVTPADAEWTGVVSGPAIPLLATATQAGGVDLDPATLSAITLALTLTGHADFLGSLLPVQVIGELSPRWVLCSGEWMARCSELKPLTKIRFAGRLKSPLIWQPVSIRVDD